MSVTVRPRSDGARPTCPFCRDQVEDGVDACACGVLYHPECRAELSRCATIGCAGKSGPGRPRASHRRDVTCSRCRGLIRNDGDMCFGCWSAFHRDCLAQAGGCCGSRRVAGAHSLPRRVLRRLLETPATTLLILVLPVLSTTVVGRGLGLAFYPRDGDVAEFVRLCTYTGALSGVVFSILALISHEASRRRTE